MVKRHVADDIAINLRQQRLAVYRSLPNDPAREGVTRSPSEPTTSHMMGPRLGGPRTFSLSLIITHFLERLATGAHSSQDIRVSEVARAAQGLRRFSCLRRVLVRYGRMRQLQLLREVCDAYAPLSNRTQPTC